MSHTKQPEKYIQADDWSNFANKYEKGTGGTTRYIAKHLLAQSPPFKKDSVVLDNACGTGIVTEEIQESLRSQPDVTIKVFAADAAPQMVRVFDAKIEKSKVNNSWPNIAEISTHIVRAEELDESIVPSDIVTHAYMNFGIFFCSDPFKAARHVYRTLAPGGTAIFTTWADLGYEAFMRKTEATCNPGNEGFVLPFADDWKKPEYVASVLRDSGFSDEKIKTYQQPSLFRAKTVAEMSEMHSELFATLIRGPRGFENSAEKEEWRKTLMGNIVDDEHFIEEADGVAVKMLANVAICTK